MLEEEEATEEEFESARYIDSVGNSDLVLSFESISNVDGPTLRYWTPNIVEDVSEGNEPTIGSKTLDSPRHPSPSQGCC